MADQAHPIPYSRISFWRLLRVEVRKILSQRTVAGLLIWIWPIGGILLPLLMVVLMLVDNTQKTAVSTFIPQWTDTALSIWTIPTSIFGRLLFIALAGTLFAGEYTWDTWKIIVPRADRIRLILVKYVAFTLLLLVAFVIMSVLLTVGIGIIQTARGIAYPPTLTTDTIRVFLSAYFIQLMLTAINTLLGVAFGAIGATISRSLLGGILSGLLFIGGEIGFIAGITTLGILFRSPDIAGLARFTSALSIANIQSWATYGKPLAALMEGSATNSIVGSFVILGVWLVVLVSFNVWLFQRQDLK